MKNFFLIALFSLVLLLIYPSFVQSIDDTTEIKKVVLRSCSGWKLNRLPKVKEFIREDASRYNLPVEYVGGDPRLVFFDENETEVKLVDVSQFDRKQIQMVLEAHGFKPQ